jgi:hypothetical protein
MDSRFPTRPALALGFGLLFATVVAAIITRVAIVIHLSGTSSSFVRFSGSRSDAILTFGVLGAVFLFGMAFVVFGLRRILIDTPRESPIRTAALILTISWVGSSAWWLGRMVRAALN